MVATIRALYGAINNIMAYFTSLVLESYYGSEREGVWHGSLAIALGLTMTVVPHDLMNLLCGISPQGQCLQGYWDKKQKSETARQKPIGTTETGKRKEQGQRSYSVRKRNPGFDVTLSVPKSLSALWAAASEDLRKAIERILLKAARQTLTILEQNIPLTRRGSGGLRQEMASLAAALFMHMWNRNDEPQLHVHCIIPNLCRAADGTFLTINSHLLHQWTPALGRIFRCELAHELQKELGLKLYIPERKDGKKESWFEIEGVPSKLIERWSSRRQELMEHLQGEGSSLGTASSAKARQRATKETRKEKSKHVDPQQLLAERRAEAVRFGLTERKIEKLLHQTKPAPWEPLYQSALKEALAEMTQQHAHFTARDVVQQVCEKLQHMGVSGDCVLQQVLKDLDHSETIIRLQQVKGEQRYTTIEMWELEEQLLQDVERLRNRKGAVVSAKRIKRTLSKFPTLSSEQQTAVTHLLSSESAVRVLSGHAGAGKSFALNVVREGFEKAGYRVIGGAVAGAAKEELVRQSGIESRTVASYLYHWEKKPAQKLQDRVKHDVKMLHRASQKRPTYAPVRVELNEKTVLVLDEAGMLATKDLQRLVEHVVKANATLILVGDWKQLPPIAAGGPMHRIARNVRGAKLTENRRQIDVADRQAVQDIRQEKIQKALQNYAQRQRIVIGENRTETIELLVDAWSRSGGAFDPQNHMIFTQTREEARRINSLCQSERLAIAPLKPVINVRLGEERFFIGDRVLFHAPLRTWGIENGYRGMVIGVDPIARNLKVRLDQEPSAIQKVRGHSQTVTVSLRSLKEEDLTLGYAATTHKMQGQTVENGYLLLGGKMTNLEMTYVQATRAKEKTLIFVDRLHAGEQLQELTRAIEQSRAKNLAHDIAPTKHVLTQEISSQSIQQQIASEAMTHVAQQAHNLNPPNSSLGS